MTDGFIREFQNEFKDLIIIPSEINGICLEFYFEQMDRFCKKISKSPGEISADGLSVQINGMKFMSSFGEQEIESMNNDTIYNWKFQVIKKTHFYGIGIISRFNVGAWWMSGFQEEDINIYFYNGFNGAISRTLSGRRQEVQYNFALKLKTNDIIEMIFDAGKGRLEYKINNRKTGLRTNKFSTFDDSVAFDHIEKGENIKYRMVVSFRNGDGIKILSFSMKHR